MLLLATITRKKGGQSKTFTYNCITSVEFRYKGDFWLLLATLMTQK